MKEATLSNALMTQMDSHIFESGTESEQQSKRRLRQKLKHFFPAITLPTKNSGRVNQF
jgi:hypothetical protein